MLRPAAQLGVVVARAKLDQAGAALKVPSCILKRIGLVGRFIEDHAVGVVVVGVDFAAAASGQANDGAQAIEEVIVLAAAGQLLVNQQATATTRVGGGTASRRFVAQTQAAIGIARTVELHPLGLVGTAVGVAVVATRRVDGRRLVLGIVAVAVAIRGTGQVAVTIIVVVHGVRPLHRTGQLFGPIVFVADRLAGREPGVRGAVARRVIAMDPFCPSAYLFSGLLCLKKCKNKTKQKMANKNSIIAASNSIILIMFVVSNIAANTKKPSDANKKIAAIIFLIFMYIFLTLSGLSLFLST